MDTAVGRWLGEDATGARLAVVASRDTLEGYAGTLAALFTEMPRKRVFSATELPYRVFSETEFPAFLNFSEAKKLWA